MIPEDDEGAMDWICEKLGLPKDRARPATPVEAADNLTPPIVMLLMSCEDFNRVKQLPEAALRRIGVGIWSATKEWTQYLFPFIWYDMIPQGYPIVTINGSVERFQVGKTDDDHRFGCLAYGWIRYADERELYGDPEPELEEEEEDDG